MYDIAAAEKCRELRFLRGCNEHADRPMDPPGQMAPVRPQYRDARTHLKIDFEDLKPDNWIIVEESMLTVERKWCYDKSPLVSMETKAFSPKKRH